MDDFEVELGKLVALESAIARVSELRTQVENEGMSKGVALEAMELIPDFNNGRATAYYSPRPSFVAEYQPALEAMSNSLTVMLAAAAAALLAIVAYVAAHVFGNERAARNESSTTSSSSRSSGYFNSGSSSSSSSGEKRKSAFKFTYRYKGKEYDNAADYNRAVEEDFKKWEKDFGKAWDDAFRKASASSSSGSSSGSSSSSKSSHQGSSSSHHNGNYHHEQPKRGGDPLPSIDELFVKEVQREGQDSSLAALLRTEDPFLRDFVTKGEYTQYMIRTVKIVPALKKAMVELQMRLSQIKLAYEAVEKHQNYGDAEQAELEKNLDDMLIDSDVIKGTQFRFSGVVRETSVAKEKMGKASAHAYKYSELLKAYESSVEHVPFDQFRRAFDDVEEETGSLQKRLEEFAHFMEGQKSKQMPDTKNHKDTIHKIEHAFGMVRNDISNMMRFFVEIDRFGRSIKMANDRMHKLKVKAVDLMMKAAKENPEWLTKELRDLGNKMHKDLVAN